MPPSIDSAAPPDPARLEVISVTELEEVSVRGDRSVRWWIEQDGGVWTKVVDYPGANATDERAPQGTIWSRLVTVRVPVETRMLRVERRPRRESVKDPLEYLTEAAPPAFETARQVFRVDRDGRLTASVKGGPEGPSSPQGP